MNEHTDSIDSIMIDRLVDGELTADQRRRLLAELEGQHDGWRKCALAFIEAQTWRREMRLAVEEKSPAASAVPCDAKAAAPSAISASSSTIRPRSTWRELGAWLAVAAMLLVAFGLGRQTGDGDAREQLAVDQPAPPAMVEHIEPQSADPNAITLVVNDRAGASHRLSVPLVEAREMGAAFSDTPNWSSEELDRHLDERGLELAARRRYLPLYFEQQDKRIPFVVPVDDAVVTPVSRPVY